MKCREAQELMGAYLYGDLSPEEMRDLRTHIQDCVICREDLATRGRVISSLSDSVPGIGDADKQRVAWSVKGAVSRKRVHSRPLAIRLAPAFALAAVVLLFGFLMGRITPHNHQHIGSQETAKSRALPDAKVDIKEVPPDTTKSDKTVDQLLNLLRPITAVGTSAPNRQAIPGGRIMPLNRNGNKSHDTPAKVANESPNQVASDNYSTSPKDSSPAPKKTETGENSGATKLPRVTDQKNAETTPSDSQ